MASYNDSVSDEEEFGYHRDCYKCYTNVRKPNAITEVEGENTRRSIRRPNRGGEILARKECVICQSNKTCRGGSGYEQIVKTVTTTTAETLLIFADNTTNEYAKTELGGKTPDELILKEFYFHRTCYRNISRPVKSTIRNQEDDYRDECFEIVKEYVNLHIITHGEIGRTKQLSTYYTKLQKDKNIEIKGTSTQLLKQRLITAFGENISFFQKKKGTEEFVYSNAIPIEDDHERNWYFKTDAEKAILIGKTIKNEIDTLISPFTSWPPNASEIKNENVQIPSLLTAVLCTMLTKSETKSARVDRLVKSIGQDIIYNSTRGKTKTIKHVQVGLFTKRKTGSRLIIDCLNRLGHSMSYDEVNLVETNFAEIQFHEQNSRDFVPNNVQPSSFVTFVYDNCDHNPETLTGVSMHCTNGIIIQRKNNIIEEVPLTRDQNTPITTKRRSFSAKTTELSPYFGPPEKASVPALPNIEIGENSINEYLSKKADLLWVFARAESALELQGQTIPGWTG